MLTLSDEIIVDLVYGKCNPFVVVGVLCDVLLSPGVNPLEGSPNVKLRRLGLKDTFPTSNSKKG
jgi:hypothetical protein